MTMQRIEAQLNEATIKELDGWRIARKPAPSRSEAVRLLLEERLLRSRYAPGCASNRSQRLTRADRLGAIFALEQVPGFGPVKFRILHEAGVEPLAAINNPDLLPFTGRTGEKLRRGILALEDAEVAVARERAINQLEQADKLSATLLLHDDPGYPAQVYASNNPVPVLYVRGDPTVWEGAKAVAVVGSRKIHEPYAGGARQFAAVAARNGMVVVSGFAMGADSMGHRAAVDAGGKTVCVMPCGLDMVFPPENRNLWKDLLEHARAVFVSEFGFGRRTSSLLLRKRNKLIVAFAQGVLVAQSARTGGAMNAYRFGREQKKPVSTFRMDGSEETSGNALIERDDRTGSFAFELSDSPKRYEAWLRQL